MPKKIFFSETRAEKIIKASAVKPERCLPDRGMEKKKLGEG